MKYINVDTGGEKMSQIFDREKTRQLRTKQQTGLTTAIATIASIAKDSVKGKKFNPYSTTITAILAGLPYIYAVIRPEVPASDRALVNDILSEINSGRLKTLEALKVIEDKKYNASIRASIKEALRILAKQKEGQLK